MKQKKGLDAIVLGQRPFAEAKFEFGVVVPTTDAKVMPQCPYTCDLFYFLDLFVFSGFSSSTFAPTANPRTTSCRP